MGLVTKLDNTFGKISKFYIFLIALFLAGIVGAIDYITGYEIGFYIFYLFPISFASWYGNLKAGLIVSVLSALTWLCVDMLSRGTFRFSIILWNAFIRLLTFLLVSYGLSYFKNKRRKERNLLDFIIHDLRVPLFAVEKSIDLVKEVSEKKLGKEELDLLAAGQTSCRRAITLVNSILDLSRLEAQKMPIESNAIEVSELMHAVLKEVSIFAKRTHVILEENNESNVTNIESDRQLLFRIFINLLSNAIKISTPNSTVTFSAFSEKAGFLTFSVSDQGKGFPAHMRHKLFDKFSQMEVRKKGFDFGSGVGLNFTKMATEALGGSVAIESKEWKGTQIRVHIPIKIDRKLI